VRLWHILHSRLRSLLCRTRREADLREELQFHLERETERRESAGMRPDAARLHALRTFGGVEQTKEACRDARGTALLDSVVRDVLYAFRSFRRAPLVALTIVTTVGLGLGLVAAVFTLLSAFVFRADDVRNPHELFAVTRQPSANAGPGRFTRPQYEALVRETGVFSDASPGTSRASGSSRRSQRASTCLSVPRLPGRRSHCACTEIPSARAVRSSSG